MQKLQCNMAENELNWHSVQVICTNWEKKKEILHGRDQVKYTIYLEINSFSIEQYTLLIFTP